MEWLRDTQWLLWLGAALGLGLLEMLSLDLVFLMLVGGALAAAVPAALGLGFPVQAIVFAVVSTLLLVGVRPPLKRWASREPFLPTNAHALLGREVEAITDVTSAGGRVKLAGEVWTARTPPGEEPVPAGTAARVLVIDGATAVVSSDPRALPGRTA